MRKKFKTINGKVLYLPAKMYTRRELDEMDVDFIPNAIFFNKSDTKGNFEEVPEHVKENMIIINYPDCSYTKFSEDKLKKAIDSQIKSNSDWIIFPYFQKENDYDVKTKIDYCGDLKLQKDIDNEIILIFLLEAYLQLMVVYHLSNSFYLLLA